MTVEVLPLRGLPEVHPGDDLALLLEPVLRDAGLRDGDVLAVTQKIVSKAEGRVVPAGGIDWIAAESRRIVARREDIVIAETRHGFVCANAGVDASNVAEGFVCLLPEDPDGSAEALRASIAERLGASVGVVVTDTFGRAWRRGVVNVAIGCAGLPALVDLRGSTDDRGRELTATIVALADEAAAASGLAMPKAGRIPAAIVRGVSIPSDVAPGAIGASALVRPPEEDLFRESPLWSLSSRRATGAFGHGAVPRLAVEEAVRAACTAPAREGAPWAFVAVESETARRRLLATMLPAPPEALVRAPLLVVPLVGLAALRGLPPADAAAERDALLLSSGAAVQGLLLALHAQGLVSCWLPSSPAPPEAIRAELSLDEEWAPVGIIAAGWPPEDSPLPDPPLDLAERLRYA